MFRHLLILCLSFLFGAYFSACSSQVKTPPQQVCFDDQCVQIEVAQTPEERAKGFQNRRYLNKDKGMLFFFSKNAKHSFWMKDTFIPLDIVWLDQNKRIATIMPGILPCKTEQCPVYTPDKDARYVLEVGSGVTIELGLKVGDQAIFY